MLLWLGCRGRVNDKDYWLANLERICQPKFTEVLQLKKLIFSFAVIPFAVTSAFGNDLTSKQVGSLPLPPRFTATYLVDKTVGVPADKAAEVRAVNEVGFKAIVGRGLMTKEQLSKIERNRNSPLEERPKTSKYQVTMYFSGNRFLIEIQGEQTREAIAYDGHKSVLLRLPDGNAAVFEGNLAYQMLGVPYFYGRLPGLDALKVGKSGGIESLVPGSANGQAPAYLPASVTVDSVASALRLRTIDLHGMYLRNDWLPTDSAVAPPSAYFLTKYVGYDSKHKLVPYVVVEAHRVSYSTTFDESDLAPERLMTEKTPAQAGEGKDLVGFVYVPGRGDLAKQEADYREYLKRGLAVEAGRKIKAGSSAVPLVLSSIIIVLLGGIGYYAIARRGRRAA